MNEADRRYTHRCPDCGKTCFTTRKAAKAMGRRLYPGDRMVAYRCGDAWHYGHLPNAVRHGALSRTALNQPNIREAP